MKYDDNIVKQKPWFPPYYFVVTRFVAYDKAQEKVVVDITDNPAMAYLLWEDRKQYDKDSFREVIWNYAIEDSFGKDAFEFCRQKAGIPKEQAVRDTK